MKVKIFRAYGEKPLEDSINDFIKDVEVVKISQSETAAGQSYSLTLCVWYNEKEQK